MKRRVRPKYASVASLFAYGPGLPNALCPQAGWVWVETVLQWCLEGPLTVNDIGPTRRAARNGPGTAYLPGDIAADLLERGPLTTQAGGRSNVSALLSTFGSTDGRADLWPATVWRRKLSKSLALLRPTTRTPVRPTNLRRTPRPLNRCSAVTKSGRPFWLCWAGSFRPVRAVLHLPRSCGPAGRPRKSRIGASAVHPPSISRLCLIHPLSRSALPGARVALPA